MKTQTIALAASCLAAVLLPALGYAADAPAPVQIPKIAPGPFAPTFESLKQYKYPDWFRDAKLGIWAHWGPQSVPMAGDWYARNMYIQGQGQYENHLKNYGHPSEKGFKDIIPLWKAEKWDPDRLMGLYKKAGARYFVSMGVHHDSFDLWNSHFNKWNAVNMGPKRDVVGTWEKAARKQGLRFGVSEHLGASFTWYQVSHGSDKTGPKAGVPYDGADPQYQDLYHFPAEPGDTGWYSNNPRWHQEWFRRIQDLVDNYHPDLLYSDGAVPFGNDFGRAMIAHLYNTDMQRHNGRLEAVYNCKQKSEGMWVEDLERGVMPGIRPQPWQTDTSIGDWFYNKDWKFRNIDWVINMLVDIVSKNGNLLLNVVQRPDGSLDPEVETLLGQMADWTAVNGEGIFGTRPWIVYGEGPTKAKGGNFKEDFGYSAADIRFTTKGKTLYAFALGWPADGKLLVKTLAKTPASGKITKVSLLGYKGKIQWTQTADGLAITLPAQKLSDHAIALKINGQRLNDFTPLTASAGTVPVKPDANGNIALPVANAQLTGAIQTEQKGEHENLGFWDSAFDSVSWKFNVPAAATYEISFETAAANSGSEVVVEMAGQKLNVPIPGTGAWETFKPIIAGRVEITKTGEQILTIRPRDEKSWKAINLAEVKLRKVQ
jgi:alpha-L-fucosidase